MSSHLTLLKHLKFKNFIAIYFWGENLISEIIFELTKARNSISEYCINTCKAQCCRIGKLPLYDDEEEKIILTNKYLKEQLEINDSGISVFNFSKFNCPHLNSNNLCEIHTFKRPYICSHYPIFLKDEVVFFSQDCPAVKEGLLDSYALNIKKLGFVLLWH